MLMEHYFIIHRSAWLEFRVFVIFMSSSSSYPVYPAHRKLWSGSGKGRETTAHTHIVKCGQRVPRLKKGHFYELLITNICMRRFHRETCLMLGLNNPIIETFSLWVSCFAVVSPWDGLILDGLLIDSMSNTFVYRLI